MNMNPIRAIAMLAVTGALATTAYGEALDQACAGTDVTVRAALEWASRDHGYNEGAVCGAEELSGIPLSDVITRTVARVLGGNFWDRTNMMGAARAAAQIGYMDQAVNAAICSQVHNRVAEACLARSGDAISAWLLRP